MDDEYLDIFQVIYMKLEQNSFQDNVDMFSYILIQSVRKRLRIALM